MDETEITGDDGREATRLTGHVHKLVEDDAGHSRGYGFIHVGDGTGDVVEYFVHRKGFGDPLKFDALRVGDRVTFEPRNTAKGLRAVLVERV